MLQKKIKLYVIAVLLILLSFLYFMTRTRLDAWKEIREEIGHISLPRTSLILLNTTPHQQLSPDYHSTTKVRLDSIKSRHLPMRTYFDCISSVEKDCCAEPHCQEYLSDFDRASVKWCSKKTFKNETSTVKGDCEFMRGEGRAPVALASLPGSGNTWIRGLLEKATGICTGSIYCDRGLRKEVFDAEGIRSGSVLVVKTHRSRYAWTDINKPQTLQWSKAQRHMQPKFGAVILILRNPYQSLVAEWNRLNCNKTRAAKMFNSTRQMVEHIGTVNQQHFRANTNWTSFIHNMMENFKNYVENVILMSPPDLPKLVVRYEDFQKDRVREVSRVLDFLHFPYSHETLSQRLEEDFNSFHRNRHTEFEHYTQYQEQFIDHTLRKLLDRLSARNSGETYGIADYLRNE